MRRLLKQRGSVLLSVLIVLMLASIMVVALQSRQSSDARRTMQFIRTVQAWHYAIGAEEYAKELLHDSFDGKTLADYPAQAWAKPKPAFKLPQGELAMQITDLQSRFNLNSLAQTNSRPSDIFSQLMLQSAVDPRHAQAILAAIRNLAAAGAARGAGNPQAAAMQGRCGGVLLFTDPSQLIDLGLSVDDYRKIASSVTVLPDTCLAFNINTVSPLLGNIIVTNPTKRAAVAQFREQQGYLSNNDVARLGLGDGITSYSRYFGVQVRIKDEFGDYNLSSVLYRSPGSNNGVMVKTLSRNWQSCPECGS